MIFDEMLSEKPSLRSLRDVIQTVAPYSNDIAIELGLEKYLRIVQEDYRNNCVVRCQKIFQRFLESENAKWGEVLRLLKKMNFNTIANDTEKQLPG